MTERNDMPVAAWFLGPKAEHNESWEKFLVYIFRDYVHWRRNYFPEDNVVVNRSTMREHDIWFDNLTDELDKILAALKAHFPVYSPRYIAHMISEQTLPSVVGYFAGMLYNPNNVTDESAPVTVPLELEVGRMVARMLGYNPETAWAHICSGGTVANIEALWVARTVKFMPFIIREFCELKKLEFRITTPNGESIPIVECPNTTLINISPDEAAYMIRRLAHYMVIERGMSAEEVQTAINEHIDGSKFNVIKVGLPKILATLGMEPVVFVSPSAHYSVKKAVNVLGYGENSIRLVGIDSNFRMDAKILRKQLSEMADNEYVAAVIAIAGTTEEGAVDPIYEINEIRREMASSHNRSFWLHIDAAYGGYLRSLFKGYDPEITADMGIDQICKRYIDIINSGEARGFRWDDPSNCRAFLAFPESDSITIDPHKLGYIPYPGGMIAFKNGMVTELIAQEAPYISGKSKEIDLIKPHKIDAIGQFILEGSKPGATAAACYLAHKTIPLVLEGHGKLMKTSLLNAQELFGYLAGHWGRFESYAAAATERNEGGELGSEQLFTFVPLYKPDTNIVCFIMVPVVVDSEGYKIDESYSLADLNKINRLLYSKLTIDNTNKLHMPYIQDFFVSRSVLGSSIYPYQSLRGMLERFGIGAEEYDQEGLFIFRSTVMNPFYDMAERGGTNYLEEFVISLHNKGRLSIWEFLNDI